MAASAQNSFHGISIPPRPQVLIDVQKQLDNPQCTVHSLGKIIARDPVVSSKVVKVVNSPAFGLTKRVESIPQAISLLGLRATANIVTGCCLEGALGTSPFLTSIWECTERVALSSYFLAHYFGSKDADLSYMLGLFLESGMGLLDQKFTNYPEVISAAYLDANVGRITDVEKHYLDTHHAVTGYYVAKSWHLPATVSRIIRDHHSCVSYFDGTEKVDPSDQTLMAILKLAEHMAGVYERIGGQTVDHEWDKLKPLVLDHLNCSEEAYNELMQLDKM